jgi:branched-chain amino acid transport system permease protein
MVYGVLRFINFAHGDVFMIGAFAGFYVAPVISTCFGAITRWVVGHPHIYIAPFLLNVFAAGPSWLLALLVLVAAMVVCAVLGIVIEKLAYRPLRNRPRLTVLITAIGVSLFLEYFGQYAFGADPQYFPDLIGDHPIDIPAVFGPLAGPAGLTIMVSQALVFAVTLFLLIALWYVVTKTKLGMAMRAFSVNPVATSLMGVNNDVVISFTFALGSALAGAAGILISIQQPSIDPLMGLQPGIKAFVAAVLGGIGNIPGAALGGVLIGVIETLVVGYSDRVHIPPGYKDAVAFLFLILILLFKPTGLLGRVEREKV